MQSQKMSMDVKELLNIFDKVGVASKERFKLVKSENSPSTLMPDFKSVIVYASGDSSNHSDNMGEFDDYFGVLTAQTDVIDYLANLGYKSFVVSNSNSHTSLVKMGIEAGVGELSPVDSLVVKGLGLTATLGAIITDAPLLQDDRVSNVCIKCMKCLRICPIRDVENAKGDLSKCGCGKCKNLCPV